MSLKMNIRAIAVAAALGVAAPAFAQSSGSQMQGGNSMPGMDMQAMMNQCKQMRQQMNVDEGSALRQQLAKLSKSAEIQAILGKCAADDSAAPAQRQLAFDAMREAAPKDTPAGWLDAIRSALHSNDPAVISAALSTARALPIKKDSTSQLSELLVQVASRGELAPQSRLSAIAALPVNSTSLDQSLFAFVLSQTSPNHPVNTRLLAADAVNRIKLSEEQFKPLAEALKFAGPLELDRLLAAFEKSSDADIGAALIESLKNAKAIKSLSAESLRKHLAKYPDDVKRQAEELIASLNPDSSKQKAHLEELLAALPTGDIRRGQLLFHSEKAACYTCHAIGYMGGTVGPDLTRVGAIRQERDLLESIVYPSASFVQSYAPVIVDTTDNDRQVGILKKDDAEEIALLTGPNQLLTIPRAKIKGIRPSPLSLMPEGLEQLITKEDLADLLAFLKACK